MNPTLQASLVISHLSTLAAEAAAERLAAAAHVNEPKPSIREALGRRLIAVGTLIGAAPIIDDPCADAGAPHRA